MGVCPTIVPSGARLQVKFNCLEPLGVGCIWFHYENVSDGVEEVLGVLVVVLIVTPE